MRPRSQFALAFCIAVALCLCPVLMCAAPVTQHHCCPAKKAPAVVHADCHLCQFMDTSQAPLAAVVDAPAMGTPAAVVSSPMVVVFRVEPRASSPRRLIPLRI